MNFGPNTSTVRRMIGANILRRAADHLYDTDKDSMKLLDALWFSFGFGALGDF